MIKAILARPGMNQEKAAALFGVAQSTIHRWANGAEPLGRHWAKIEQIYSEGEDIPRKTEIGPGTNKHIETNATIGAPMVSSAAFKVRLFGHAVGGADGEFVLNGSSDLGEVFVPPSISSISGAYAVTVAGDSMSPRYDDGEIVVVDPNHRARRGDYVVVQIQGSEHGAKMAYIKRFVRHTAEGLVLEQLNPPKELRFDHASVFSVHYVVMSGNLPRA